MTDPHAAPAKTPLDHADDRSAARADRRRAQAEGRSFDPVTSVRQAVRDDLSHGRTWARTRMEHTREAIQDEPLKTMSYAAGVGVLIGLLLRR